MKFEPLKERDPPPNHKVVVKKVEIERYRIERLTSVEVMDFFKRQMVEHGFNLNRKFSKEENLDKLSITLTQKKYIIPKVKRHEET